MLTDALTEDDREQEFRERLDELETENEQLRREKRLLLELREEHTELVSAVNEERSLAQRRANAGVLTRAKWWLVGMDGEGTDRKRYSERVDGTTTALLDDWQATARYNDHQPTLATRRTLRKGH